MYNLLYFILKSTKFSILDKNAMPWRQKIFSDVIPMPLLLQNCSIHRILNFIIIIKAQSQFYPITVKLQYLFFRSRKQHKEKILNASGTILTAVLTEELAECDLYVNFRLQNNISRFLYKNVGGLKNSITNILLLILNSEVKSKWYSEDKRNFCTLGTWENQ